MLTSYPYNVKDYAVNVVVDTAKDIAVVDENGKRIGYGYYVDSSEMNAIDLVLNNLSNTAVANFLPNDITCNLVKNEPIHVPYNENATTIVWNDSGLTISSITEPYMKLCTNDGRMVGMA